MLTSEFGQPILGSTGQPIRRAVQTTPGSIMLLNDGATLGQLDASTPDTGLMDKLLELLSFTTTIPAHHWTGQFPSGVALQMSEARLNHRIEDHQGRLTSSIVAMLRLTLRLSNNFAGTTYDVLQPITIPWFSPQIETEDLKREREGFAQDSITKLVGARLMSKETALRTLHPDWSDDDLLAEMARLDADKPPAPPITPVVQPVDTQPE